MQVDRVALVLAAVLAMGPSAFADSEAARVTPPAADLSVTYSPHAAHRSCHMNMGATGATAWMRGYHFVVMSMQQQSPGYGKLMLGDVVTGTVDQAFGPDADPRKTLGDAIADAEETGKPLRLAVLREGKPVEVVIELPHLGAPDQARARILDEACQSVLTTQLPNGNQPTDGSFGLFGTGLTLLASGDPRYLDPARRAAYHVTEMQFAGVGMNNWPMGYGGVLLAEYYLATGDDSVLPKLQEIVQLLAEGQMACGSWGHKSPAGGYGALNQPGLLCAMTLVLAKECGLDVDQDALDRTLHFFGRYAGTGAVPYGDHRPGRGMDDNGKSAMAAVLFNLHGDEVRSQAFAQTVADSYWNREQGHTGGYFSIMWGPIGVALAGDDKLEKFLAEQRWYYALHRKWTGALTILPYREALTRFDSSSYIGAGGRFSTGGLALPFALPHKRLRILGAPPSVFGVKADLTDDLRKARNLYVVRNWDACDAALAAIDPAKLRSDDERAWLGQLKAARDLSKRATERVLLEIDAHLRDGGPYWALQQFEALKQCLGANADPRFAKLEERFEQGTTAWHVREGVKFHERWEQWNIAKVISWVPQGAVAQRILEGAPTARLPYWETLSPTSDLVKQAWRTKLYAGDASPESGWEQPGFDDGGWHRGDGILTRHVAKAGEPSASGAIAARRVFNVDDPAGERLRVRLRTVRPALTKVYLNGTLIVDVERGQRGGYARIMLDDRTLGLLKKGENVLAVTSTKQGPGNNHLDVGLDINRTGFQQRHLPIERATLRTLHLPADVDTSLKVADEARRYAQSLKETYHDLATSDLLAAMGSVNHYYRALAADALVAKGPAGIKAAVARLKDADWKVRSAALGVIAKAIGTEEGGELVKSHVDAVTACLTDGHFWVRVRACQALGKFGGAAKGAIPALVKAANDPEEEWVRDFALLALPQVGAGREVMMEASQAALGRRNSAYYIARRVTSVVKQSATDAENLALLVEILRTPPEGGGGRLLVEVIDMACKLDPQGKVMIPVLIDAAADKTHLSRQRGNPRGKAIEALGGYGPRAAAAVNTLKALLEEGSGVNDGQREAARAALEAIAG